MELRRFQLFLGDAIMILNIRELVGNHRSSKKIDVISNSSANIEDAKAKVKAIIDSGAMKRKKIRRRKKRNKEE